MESRQDKIRPSQLAIDVDFQVGSAFDAEPCFKTEQYIQNGKVVRPENYGLYLRNPDTGLILTAFIKNMPVEDYDGQSEIPIVIRTILPETKEGKSGIVYLEQRLEVGDTICLKPDKKSNMMNMFITRFLSYDLFVRTHCKDGRKFYLNEPMAVIIERVHPNHKNANAMPYERISQEQYEANKFKIIRAKKD